MPIKPQLACEIGPFLISLNLESIASVQDRWDCCMKVNTENQVDWDEYLKEEAVIILYG